jgi:hypothetical protein
MAAPLQRDEQLLDFIQFYVVARKAGYMIGKYVTLSADIGDMAFTGHLSNAGSGGTFCVFGHAINIASKVLRIH